LAKSETRDKFSAYAVFLRLPKEPYLSRRQIDLSFANNESQKNHALDHEEINKPFLMKYREYTKQNESVE
jgi:hypothetical protein